METVVSILIPAIVESVFGALTEAVGLSDWLRQRLGRDPEKLAFHQALTQALTDSATHYPGRDLRYFAEILRDISGPVLARTLQPAASLPTADELTTIWLNHLTVDSLIHYRVGFTQFGTHFLERLQFHLENQQPLQWITQARRQRSSEEAMHRMAEVAEQNAINLDALRQELASLTTTLETVLQTDSGSTVTTGGGAYIGGNVSAQHFAGRDLTINQYFVEGLARLVFNYSARIENFLFEYLGRQGQRVPFGGRQAQIDQLNTWLDNPDAPPYLLMVAEAGGGKSALVTRWSAQLTSRTDLEVIFAPISIRFQTAAPDVAFAALAARLAQIHEQQATLPAALSAEQWKGQCETYLRLPLPAGKRLLIVIDGLDEATGWEAGPELFAKRPSVGLRILVTARVRAKETDANRWAVRLGWQDDQIAHKLHLPGLDRHGIAEALVSMGNPLDHLATQVDLVGELHRLSKGDPLVVRLYVEALQEMGATVARLRPEDLAGIEPGLDGFMDRWWADQRKQWQMQGKDPFAEEERLLPLLHACTVACGPLLPNDLAELDKQHFGKGLLITHMAELLGRWVIGDGKKQGYVFSHPRLRNYFGDRMTPHEDCEWQAKFCNWGERVLTALNIGTLEPKQAPEYLLRYYSTYLERSHASSEKFYALICNGWRMAWAVLDVSYGGFLNDVDRAWQQARLAYDPNQFGRARALVCQVRAALCRSSVAAMGNNMPTELLVQLVATGLYTPTQTLAIVKLIPDEKKRTEMLVALIDHLPAEFLKEALGVTRTIRNESDRAYALNLFAPYLPPDLLEEALSIARAIRSEYYHAYTLGILVPHLPKSKRRQVLVEALDTTCTISDEFNRTYVVRMLAPHLPVELLEEALHITHTIGSEDYRASALRSLVAHLPAELLEEALHITHTIGNKRCCADVLRLIALRLPESRQVQVLEEALDIAYEIASENYRTDALRVLISHLSAELLLHALSLARMIESKSHRAVALGILVPHLPESKRGHVLEEALNITYLISDAFSCTYTLRVFAPYLPPDLMQEALNIACAIESEDYRVDALRTLIPHLPTQLLTAALNIARTISGKRHRAITLSLIALRLPESKQGQVLEEALVIAYEIDDKSYRAIILRLLASYLAENEREKALREAVFATCAIKDEHTRARALITLPRDLSNDLWSKVLTTACAIKDEKDRVDILIELIRSLPDILISKALEASNSIESRPLRIYLLSRFAPHLSQYERIIVLEKALVDVRVIGDKNYRILALNPLAIYLSKSIYTLIQQETLVQSYSSFASLG